MHDPFNKYKFRTTILNSKFGLLITLFQFTQISFILVTWPANAGVVPIFILTEGVVEAGLRPAGRRWDLTVNTSKVGLCAVTAVATRLFQNT